ncbi:hypothetical protein M758_9G109900 [Ceratodon purpureus]|nr:hypothetical protein M758_9G109900 [Ceratodon purpureus]
MKATGVLWKLSDTLSAMMLHECSSSMLTTAGRGLISRHSNFFRSGRAHGHHSTIGISGNRVKAVDLRGSEWARTAGAGSLSGKFRCCVIASGSDLHLSASRGNMKWSEMESENETLRKSPSSCKVAVIGAGAAGLVAARELIREGHDVILFEQTESVGGVWVYDPEIEDDDLLGVRKARKRVHSSMYASLRTNLPREIMGYTDFPFLPKEGRDGRRFPGHAEVAAYLEDFAEFYGILNYVQFCTVVEYVGVCKKGNKISWNVRTRRRDETEGGKEEVFDAVVVCNGHYSEPKLAEVPGISKWPGVQLHSHNYREPGSFTDKIVVVIGNAASGEDISREIARVAKEVHISGRTWSSNVDFSEPIGDHGNIWRHTMIECACEDGTVKFKSGGSVSADIIMHCTGYFYYFPFLDTQGEVGVDDNCVGPLYQHVFPPSLAPSIGFVGLPWKVVPFQLCELQSRWIAMALSGKISLPSPQEMINLVQDFYAKLEASGKTKRLAHNLATSQYEYDNWLSDQTGSAPVETWRIKIYEATSRNKRHNPETYRDVWPDEDLHHEAFALLEQIDLSARL